MNWQHLQAFLWLRWRLLANQWRRSGQLNAVLMTILAVGLLVLAIPLFFACLLMGIFSFAKTDPETLLYAWDVMVLVFVFFWSFGLLTELQRTETLSLSKFMHLPVSLSGALLINFISYLLCLSLIVFVPVLFGFGLSLVVSRGWLLISVLPLTAAFLLMVTAVTYQFQGWLASLMSNPRRRRTVVVAVTTLFVLVFQVPNLLNVWMSPKLLQHSRESAEIGEELQELNSAFQSQVIDESEYLRRQQDITARLHASVETMPGGHWRPQESLRLVNLIVPLGWLPLGVMAAAEGKVLPPILGCLGMTLIGAGCLWRSYRTTIGLYQGQFTSRKSSRAAVAAVPVAAGKQTAGLLEAQLPGLSEPVSAIALAAVRSLLRSPESKMLLLSALVMNAAFGSFMLRSSGTATESVRTLRAIGAIALALFSSLQMMANQFGFDRDGFRVFVLCAVPRRDILLGKNLAFAPLTLGMAAILVIVVQIVCPLRVDHLLSMVPQAISMFLLFCILTNLLSIYTPMQIAAGSLKPSQPKLVSVLLQVATILMLFPLIEVPTLLPLVVEAGLEWYGWAVGAPICLALSLVECAAIVIIYRLALNWQGRLLRAGEQRILEVVTNRAA